MAVAQWLLPHLSRRPLSLLRCPEGLAEECFFQKHPEKTFTREVPRVAIPEKRGDTSDYVYVSSVTELVWLVQYGVLEFHPWGCRVDDLERPDTLIFDLDPGPDLVWNVLAETATSLRDRLNCFSNPGTNQLPSGYRRQGASPDCTNHTGTGLGTGQGVRPGHFQGPRPGRTRKADPWENYKEARSRITRPMLKQFNLE